MIDDDLIASLSCPYCRSGLDLVVRNPPDAMPVDHGVVRCSCYQYPIVDGILVLRQTSAPFEPVDAAVVALNAGDVGRARTALKERTSMVGRTSRRTASDIVPRLRHQVSRLRFGLGGIPPRGRARDVAASPRVAQVRRDLEHHRPGGYADYLYQRYANPSFVASVPMMALLEEATAGGGRTSPAVLDLGCGTGHSTAMMRVLFPRLRYVAADPDFVNLLLLRRHFERQAACICLDAELPLPFSDDQFDAVFCLDAFHYIRSKWALARELDRVVDDGGVWIFPHLHNADSANPNPGLPLRAADYLRIFGSLDAVLVDEASVLRDFLGEHVLNASIAPAVDDVGAAAVFALFGSRRRRLGGRYRIGERLIDADRTALGVNPIYEVTHSAKSVELRMRWPSPGLEAECATIRDYLPQCLELDRHVWRRITEHGTSPRDEAEVAELIRSFVLVHLPPGYAHLANGLNGPGAGRPDQPKVGRAVTTSELG